MSNNIESKMSHLSAQVLDINIKNTQYWCWKNVTCYKINFSDEKKELSIKFLSKERCIFSCLDVYNAIFDDKFETFWTYFSTTGLIVVFSKVKSRQSKINSNWINSKIIKKQESN